MMRVIDITSNCVWPWFGAASFVATLAAAPLSTANSAPYQDPPVFASANGHLNLVVVAERIDNKAVSSFFPGASGNGPDAWVYQVCQDQPAGATSCPAGSVAPYGGVRLALKAGDELKITFVNKLPVGTDFANAAVLGDYLLLNPSDLHTHGMIVEPRTPTMKRPTYGDDIYVLDFNTANGAPIPPPPTNSHIHFDIMANVINYDYDIPSNHPSGPFFLHPHPHGISMNQMEAGLSSIITIGDVSDRICADPHCSHPLAGMTTRHFVLKDTQYEKGNGQGQLSTQIDSAFCATNAPQNGYCNGVDDTAIDGLDHTGGKWFFPLSGQIYPDVEITSGQGEIWSFTNASGSATYDLRLTDNRSGYDMAMQVISVDGIAIDTPVTALPGDLVRIASGKIRIANCPRPSGPMSQPPLCANSITMMPTSRVEVWVTYRDQNGNLMSPANGVRATLRTAGVNTGPIGDGWPAVNLANIGFAYSGTAPSAYINVRAIPLFGPGAIFSTVGQPSYPVPSPLGCTPLPAGWHRRIFFGLPASNLNLFGTGYELVDQNGNVVSGSAVDVAPFNLTTPPVCVQLGWGNTPVTEVWEVVNLAGELHNFHIHQTKFRVVDPNAPPSSPLYTAVLRDGPQAGGATQPVYEDNAPLPYATSATNPNGCIGLADYHAGKCTATPVWLEIPFKWAGEFVYHCHILEHEDGGMMNKVIVATHP
jgi:L-ascorbate oxidase